MSQESSQGPVVAPEDVNFDAFYRGEAPLAGSDVTFELVPWDIHEAQPALVRLESGGEIRSDVLDAGCGLGENTLFLAERGYQVVGVDGSRSAIEQAGQRAAERGARAEFTVGDVTRLDGLDQRFNTVLDSALYHCLGAEQRDQYSAALHRVTLPGAQLHLFCFADVAPEKFPGPAPVSQEDLRTHLGRHWNITSIELTSYTTAFTHETLQRHVDPASREKLGIAVDIDNLDVDDRGRILASVWHLRAERL